MGLDNMEMKPEEAKEIFNKQIKCCEKIIAYSCNTLCKHCQYNTSPGEMKSAMEIAVHALEKQIPKPVKITTSTIRCGECNRQLSGIGNIHSKRNYCQGCGQAIKWDKE